MQTPPQDIRTPAAGSGSSAGAGRPSELVYPAATLLAMLLLLSSLWVF